MGPGTGELRGVAETNAQRAAALEDSLALQYQQIAQLRAIITGEMDDLGDDVLDPAAFALPDLDDRSGLASRRRRASAPASDQTQPALPLSTLGPAVRRRHPRRSRRAGLPRRPAPADVPAGRRRGVARVRRRPRPLRDRPGGDRRARRSAPSPTATSSSPTGRTAGGHTIAVQHPGGYLSVYKHNSRLLMRVGERVRARETVALSGNTGEITSGPHLHFEVWRDGLAQDPSAARSSSRPDPWPSFAPTPHLPWPSLPRAFSGNPAEQHNIIGASTTVEGTLRSSGNVNISGTVDGNVEVEGRTMVMPGGVVEGEVATTSGRDRRDRPRPRRRHGAAGAQGLGRRRRRHPDGQAGRRGRCDVQRPVPDGHGRRRPRGRSTRGSRPARGRGDVVGTVGIGRTPPDHGRARDPWADKPDRFDQADREWAGKWSDRDPDETPSRSSPAPTDYRNQRVTAGRSTTPTPTGCARPANHLGTGLQIGVSMVFFVGLGLVGDRWLGTSPWGVIVGAVLGMVGIMTFGPAHGAGGSGEVGAPARLGRFAAARTAGAREAGGV